jgi:hypothetical protein
MTVSLGKWLTIKVSFGVALLVVTSSMAAQQGSKIPRLGYLTPSTSPTSYFEHFQQGLRELGYIEGKTLSLNDGLMKESWIVTLHWRQNS